LIPAVGILLNPYLIYAAFFSALWSDNFRTGKSVVIACVALLAAQLGTVAYVRLYKPQLLRQNTPIGADIGTD
jgi:hypothetical protein